MGGGVCIQPHSTTPTSVSSPPSPEGDMVRGGIPDPSFMMLYGIDGPHLVSTVLSLPAQRLGAGISDVLVATPPLWKQGATYLQIYTCPPVALWAAAWGCPNVSPQNTGPSGFVYSGDSGGSVGASLGSGDSPYGRRCGGTIGPYNVQNCAGGPIWIHSET